METSQVKARVEESEREASEKLPEGIPATIDFRTYDPSHPEFQQLPSVGGTSNIIQGTSILVEDCSFRFAPSDVLRLCNKRHLLRQKKKKKKFFLEWRRDF